jgi:hypothetical protein
MPLQDPYLKNASVFIEKISDLIDQEYPFESTIDVTKSSFPQNLQSAIEVLRSTTDELYPLYLIEILSSLFSSILKKDYAEGKDDFTHHINVFINSIDFKRLSTKGISEQPSLTRQLIVFTFIAHLFHDKELLDYNNRKEILKDAAESIDEKLINIIIDPNSISPQEQLLEPEQLQDSFADFFKRRVGNEIFTSPTTTEEIDSAVLNHLDFLSIFAGTIIYDAMLVTLSFSIAIHYSKSDYEKGLDDMTIKHHTTTLNKLCSLDFKGSLLSLAKSYPHVMAIMKTVTLSPRTNTTYENRIYLFLKHIVFKNDDMAFVEFVQQYWEGIIDLSESYKDTAKDYSTLLDQYAATIREEKAISKAVKAATKPLETQIELLSTTISALARHMSTRETEISGIKAQLSEQNTLLKQFLQKTAQEKNSEELTTPGLFNSKS